MSIRDWLLGTAANKAPAEVKSSAASSVMASITSNIAVWTKRDYSEFAKEAYVKNAIANRCVHLISSGCAEAMSSLVLIDGEDEITRHPVLDLLARPCPQRGAAETFKDAFSYLLLSGNMYLEGVGIERHRPPKEIHPLRPDRVKVFPSVTGFAKRYEYQLGNGSKTSWEHDPSDGFGPIGHVKEFHPVDDWYGLSRVEPAGESIDTYNSGRSHNKSLLDNGARPGGILSLLPLSLGAEGEELPTDEEVIAVKRKFESEYTGPSKSGKTMFLSGKVQWQDMASTLRDMDFSSSMLSAARDICEAFGVPHILVVPGSSTYNNLYEARQSLFEDTVIPMTNLLVSYLNWWLLPTYGLHGANLSIDLDSVPALEPKRAKKRQSVIELYDKRLLTRSEARSALGYGGESDDEIDFGALNPATIQSLTSLVPTIGPAPLLKYLKAVGLEDDGKTTEQLLREIMENVEGDEDADPEGIEGKPQEDDEGESQ